MDNNDLYISLLTLLKQKYIKFSNLIGELDIYNTYIRNIYNSSIDINTLYNNIFYNKCLEYIYNTKEEIYYITREINEIEQELFKICT